MLFDFNTSMYNSGLDADNIEDRHKSSAQKKCQDFITPENI